MTNLLRTTVMLALWVCSFEVYSLDKSLLKNIEVKADREFLTLLKNTPDLTTNPDKLDSALRRATSAGFLESIEWLLSSKVGASPKTSDKNGFTALMTTYLHPIYIPTGYRITKRLLEQGADANDRNVNGSNALMLFIEGVMEGPRAPSACDGMQEIKVIPWKAQNGIKEYETATLQLLINATKDINVVDKGRNSALSLVIERRRYDLIAPLLAAGANPNTVMPFGVGEKSVISYVPAAMVASLVAAGGDPNWVNQWGGTPLHDAMSDRSRYASDVRKTVEALIAAGAKDKRNARGAYAFEIDSPLLQCDAPNFNSVAEIRALIKKTTITPAQQD